MYLSVDNPFPYSLSVIDMSEEYVCDLCEESFASEHGVSVHKGRSHNNPWDDGELLDRLYNEAGLNAREIANKLGCSSPTVLRKMAENGIETPIHPGHPLRPPMHEFYRRHDTVGSEYEYVSTRIDGKTEKMAVHRLVAYAHGIIDGDEIFDSNSVIHHISGHGLDNRPENLESMSRGEHMAHHWELRRE